MTIYCNNDLTIAFDPLEGDRIGKESRSFGNSHALLIDATVSKIFILPKNGGRFKIIAARIYSTETGIEIPLLEEAPIRPIFHKKNDI